MARANRRAAEQHSPEETARLARERDRFWMGFALAEAEAAREAGEVPIGAVVVLDDAIVGRGHNEPIGRRDPTAHAELLAIREAARRVGNYRLTGATLYATIEPCAMCAGAIVHARLGRLVYGAPDLRAGGVESVFTICTNSSLNHQVEVASGVDAEASRELLQSFFRARRKSAEAKYVDDDAPPDADRDANEINDRPATDELTDNNTDNN